MCNNRNKTAIKQILSQLSIVDISLHTQPRPYVLVAKKLLVVLKTSIYDKIVNQAQIDLVSLNMSWAL